MRLLGIFLTLALLAAPASAGDWKVDTAWIAVGQTADFASTEYVLNRCPGCYEFNPLIQTTMSRAITKAAVTVGGGLVCRHLRKKGKHKQAKILRWTLFGLGIAATAWNVNQIP